MAIIRHEQSSIGVGNRRHSEEIGFPSRNHLASAKLSNELLIQIESLGLNRVAGNVYENPSTKDFWAVRGNKIVRLTSGEVDNGEKLMAADANAPQNFLDEILSDLTF